MAKSESTGVYQLKNGNWGYRYTITENGHKKDVRKATDESGNLFRTKKEAIKARKLAIKKSLEEPNTKPMVKKTIAEVYAEYCATGRASRAYTTIQKQESLWKNHLCARFGKRYVDDISVAEVNDYLAELYYKRKLSYRYVEGFLKMFYLFFGQAYTRNYLDTETYNKLCVNKDCKIRIEGFNVFCNQIPINQNELIQYEVCLTEEYVRLDEVLAELDPAEIGMLYTGRITAMIEVEERVRAVCFSFICAFIVVISLI